MGWKALGAVPGISLGQLSHPYRTEPVGMVSDNWFINAAGELKTSLAPLELLQCLHRLEKQFGRDRDMCEPGYLDRTLDFDLLLYGQHVQRDEVIQIPHPNLQERLFVLLPLSEIAVDVRHPISGKSVGELLTALQASGINQRVERIHWSGQGSGL